MAAVWIDYKLYVFDVSEFTVAVGTGPGGTFTNNIAVPSTALYWVTQE
jgi:predicted acetyltransferase